MKGGILQVLVVSAKGIRHIHRIGKRGFYVIIECGTQVRKSRTSKAKDNKIYWNEKFTLEFTISEWEILTHLKLRIMNEEFLKHGGFMGESIISMEGIKMEGSEKEFIECKPTPYNVVLEDGTYKGEIKIGLKFIPREEIEIEITECLKEENKGGKSIFEAIMMNLYRIPWLRFLFSYRK